MSVRLFKSLLFKSTRIQQEIEREQARPWPDRWRLLKLKKIRLAIKDRMERVIQYGMTGENARLQSVRITMPDRRAAHNH
jgi:hypothetical protein